MGDSLKRTCKKYGISVSTYLLMIKEQKGLCKICGQEEKKRNLSIDHDHETGLVRGLLCRNCNLGLGSFKDDRNLLLKAYDYLSASAVMKRFTYLSRHKKKKGL